MKICSQPSVPRQKLIDQVRAFAEKPADSPYGLDKTEATWFLRQSELYQGSTSSEMKKAAEQKLEAAEAGSRDHRNAALACAAVAVATMVAGRTLGIPGLSLASLPLMLAVPIIGVSSDTPAREAHQAQRFKAALEGWEKLSGA